MAKVSIGVPVYNGERFLSEALESLLGQTFGDFELVICDNASTDGTEALAREVARRDPRVRYERNDRNVGAARNFDRVFALCSAPYFKWAAADDLCAPTLLERCVERLDRDPGVVLAYPRTRLIDAQSRQIGHYDCKLPTDSPDPIVRFECLLRGHMCFEIFGVIRREALARTPGMGAYNHGDGVLLARLAFQGRFEEIPEVLFSSRRHPEQSGRWVDDRLSYAEWFNPALRGKLHFPHWRTAGEFLKSIWAARLGWNAFLRCHLILLRKSFRARDSFLGDLRAQLGRRARRRGATPVGSAGESGS